MALIKGKTAPRPSGKEEVEQAPVLRPVSRSGRRRAAAEAPASAAGPSAAAAAPSPLKRRRGALADAGGGAAEPGASPSRRPRGVPGVAFDGYGFVADDDEGDADADGAGALRAELMDSTIKVFCTHSEPNFSLPWQRKRQFQSSGSAFVIDTPSGRRLLTNAHVKVKRRGSDARYLARVLVVGIECDVALLAVDDAAFWDGLRPVRFGPLPHLQERVTVCGYPVGGEQLSVTEGVVSRIEVTPYAHGAADLLALQVDAAINAGNSGGPAFDGAGRCCGIAFQSMSGNDVEGISFVIPVPVLRHFLDDYERHGRYTGFPSLGVEFQKMESQALRSALGVPPGARGVLLRSVAPTGPLAGVAAPGDVLLAFDGVEIGSDGTVPFRRGERIAFSHLTSMRYAGDAARVRLLRGGAVREAGVVLGVPRRLVPVHIDGAPPSYFLVGGLVFTPATVPLLRAEYGKEYDYDAPVKLLDALMHGAAGSAREQVVVLQQVLACDAAVGYEDISNTQVLRANGRPVKCMADLVAAVEGGDGEGGAAGGGPGGGGAGKAGKGRAKRAAGGGAGRYLRFELEYGQQIVLDRAAAAAATAQQLAQHSIPRDRSADLLPPGGGGGGGGGGGADGAGAAAAAGGGEGAGPSPGAGRRRGARGA